LPAPPERPTRGRSHPARDPFASDEIAGLGRLLGVERVDAGTPLLRQGEPVGHVGVIVAGDVELRHRHGEHQVVVQVLHPGEVYGDTALLCGVPMPQSARAQTRAAIVQIPPEVFWRLVEQRPELCRRLLVSLATRLERSQRRLHAVTSGDLGQQVASVLLDEAGDTAGEVRLTQATIAQLIGSTRPSVNRALKQLATAGHLELGYGRLEVVDPVGLRGVVDCCR